MLPLLFSLLLASPPATAKFDPASHAPILTAHAEGAQIYECKAAADGATKWAFREPIAALIVDGKTVGRHYAGPHWMLDDGSLIQGKVVVTVAGAIPTDIPQLKLEVIANQNEGALRSATLVYRVRTRGGVLDGPCPTSGAFRSVAYSADYIFAR